MKSTSEQLLDDLLADAMPEGFRKGLFDTTMRSARRRKTARKLNGAAVLACIVLCSGILLWKTAPHQKIDSAAEAKNKVDVICSAALNPAQVVRTSVNSVETFSSSVSTVAMIQTSKEAGRYQVINDQQLMALLPAESAVIVRHGSHEAELIFLRENRE